MIALSEANLKVLAAQAGLDPQLRTFCLRPYTTNLIPGSLYLYILPNPQMSV